jgi:cysteinyl-tRNA synthetase
LLTLQTHYRSPLDFSDDRLDEARTSLDRLETTIRNAAWAAEHSDGHAGGDTGAGGSLARATEIARSEFETAMDDDFNTAGALGALFDLSRHINSFIADAGVLSRSDSSAVASSLGTLLELLGVLGLPLSEDKQAEYPEEVLVLAQDMAGYEGADRREAVAALLAARNAARTVKDWRAADAIRDAFARVGLVIEDTAQGARVTQRPEA